MVVFIQCLIFIIAALRKYNEVNQALPDRIIVYRDGVGDGQVLCFIFEPSSYENVLYCLLCCFMKILLQFADQR